MLIDMLGIMAEYSLDALLDSRCCGKSKAPL
jgi:hypothetical protein